jgi:hypothetical protein
LRNHHELRLAGLRLPSRSRERSAIGDTHEISLAPATLGNWRRMMLSGKSVGRRWLT